MEIGVSNLARDPSCYGHGILENSKSNELVALAAVRLLP